MSSGRRPPNCYSSASRSLTCPLRYYCSPPSSWFEDRQARLLNASRHLSASYPRHERNLGATDNHAIELCSVMAGSATRHSTIGALPAGEGPIRRQPKLQSVAVNPLSGRAFGRLGQDERASCFGSHLKAGAPLPGSGRPRATRLPPEIRRAAEIRRVTWVARGPWTGVPEPVPGAPVLVRAGGLRGLKLT
jgi:hypothetical protein